MSATTAISSLLAPITPVPETAIDRQFAMPCRVLAQPGPPGMSPLCRCQGKAGISQRLPNDFVSARPRSIRERAGEDPQCSPAKKMMDQLRADRRQGVPMSAVVVVGVQQPQPDQDSDDDCCLTHLAFSPATTPKSRAVARRGKASGHAAVTCGAKSNDHDLIGPGPRREADWPRLLGAC
jgi:hypothetical protein